MPSTSAEGRERGRAGVFTRPRNCRRRGTLEKFYHQSRTKIRELLLPIILLRGMRLSSKSVARKALEWYVEKNIDWTDAFVAAKMAAENRVEIYS